MPRRPSTTSRGDHRILVFSIAECCQPAPCALTTAARAAARSRYARAATGIRRCRARDPSAAKPAAKLPAIVAAVGWAKAQSAVPTKPATATQTSRYRRIKIEGGLSHQAPAHEIHDPILSRRQTPDNSEVRPCVVRASAQGGADRWRVYRRRGPLFHRHVRGRQNRNLAVSGSEKPSTGSWAAW
jgi:hypothetical protein